ncbi:hypothetical protein [Kitasatospora sp. NPDC094011]|uniref:hypothetical protein n=1 Tax=Kitasatospora sp. NPDC094011 TaxID=3364090 RepID=UPI0038289514
MRRWNRAAALLGVSLLTLTTPGLAHGTPGLAHGTPGPKSLRTDPGITNLDIAFTEGSTHVTPRESVSVSGTYTCNDTNDTAEALISLTLEQDGHGAWGSTTVDCQTTDGRWTVSVPFPLVQADTEIVAEAAIYDGDTQATDQAHLVRHNLFLDVDPTTTIDTDDNAVITGHYGCADPENADITIVIPPTPTTTNGTVTGTAMLAVTCPATHTPYTITVPLQSPGTSTATTAKSHTPFIDRVAPILPGIDQGPKGILRGSMLLHS